MVATRSPKNKKFRGSKTHGWGSMKKHRGAGSRGGRGNAGTGKKGNAKEPSMWRSGMKLGKFGFKLGRPAAINNPISIKNLELSLPQLVADKTATKDGDSYTVDLTKLGYTKLVGTGKATLKIKVTAPAATASAIEKIKNAGGDVLVAGAEPEAAA
ncbi:uL15 family ribosomal protein [Candidatus Woesearchaeota archaeon]|nr:uL15 family ribosomal protein [Candidatus Woesearchaeota archaeon]